MNLDNYDEVKATLTSKMDEVAKKGMRNMVDDFYDKDATTEMDDNDESEGKEEVTDKLSA